MKNALIGLMFLALAALVQATGVDKPDLVVEVPNSFSAVVGSEALVEFSVKNIGGTSSKTSYVVVSPGKFYSTNALRTGESVDFSTKFFKCVKPGRYYFFLKADFTGALSEADEKNNAALFSINCLPDVSKKPNLFIESITARQGDWASREFIEGGDNLTISLVVANGGDGSANDSITAAAVNGVFYFLATRPLSSGGRQEFLITEKCSPFGNRIVANADYYNEVVERDKGDNYAKRQFNCVVKQAQLSVEKPADFVTGVAKWISGLKLGR